MDDRTYRVILAGSVKEGFARETVIRDMAALFKRDEEQIGRLLAGRPHVIKSRMDRNTALKYKKLIERAGAVCLVEEDVSDWETRATTEPEPPPPGAQRPAASREAQRQSVTQPESTSTVTPGPRPTLPSTTPQSDAKCPRCGYTAVRDNDVLLIRGDCPKCGFVTGRTPAGLAVSASIPASAQTGTDAPFYLSATGTDPYAGRTPASARARAMATLYSSGTFLILYCGLALAHILMVAPTDRILHLIFRAFLETAATVDSDTTSVLAIAIVIIVIPLFNGGLTPGQRIAGLEMIYGRETDAGGPYTSLLFRGVGVAILSLAPGHIVIFLGDRFGLLQVWHSQLIAMVVSAALAWTAAWYVWTRSRDKIGYLDYCSGSVQTESLRGPEVPLKRALVPLMAVGAFLLLLVVVVPLLLGLTGR